MCYLEHPHTLTLVGLGFIPERMTDLFPLCVGPPQAPACGLLSLRLTLVGLAPLFIKGAFFFYGFVP